MSGRQSEENKILDSLSKNNKCFLCLGQFKRPRMLDCYHVFCQKCLDGYIEMVCPDGQIECPLCDALTKTPENGTSGLKKNIYADLEKSKPSQDCDVCEETGTAEYRCLECEQDYCENCLSYHGNITSTREHHTVSFSREYRGGKVSRTVYCPIHTDEKLSYYCVDCQELVCQHCNMTKHKQHESKYAAELSDNFRARLRRAVTSNEYTSYVLWMVDKKQELLKEMKKLTESESKVSKDINAHVEQWHLLIDATKNRLLKEAASTTKRRIQPIRDYVKTVDRNILTFAGVYQVARNIVDKADDTEIVNSAQKLVRALNRVKMRGNNPGLPSQPEIVFNAGDTKIDEFQNIFGKISQVDPNPECLFEMTCDNKSTSVSALLPIADGRVWIVEGTDGTLKLYDHSGRIHKKLHVGAPADDIAEGKDGQMFVSCNSGKEVKFFDGKEEIYAISSTASCARGIAFDSSTGFLVICLTEKNAFFDHEVSHNNKVVRLDVNSKEEEDESPLDILSFTGYPVVEYPARITVTMGGYIAISDWKRNCVTILNRSGHVETEYFGLRNKESSESFCPRGICCDKDGRILVADYNNHRVMQMDERGQLFQALLSTRENIRHPWSVAVGPDGLLWVGNKQGQVNVYRYSSLAKSTRSSPK